MNADSPALVVLDTTVLLAAVDRSREHHDAAVALLTMDERRLAVTPQIVREYLSVMTRPVRANGLGITPSDALNNVDEVLYAARLLGESAATTLQLMELVANGPTTGKQIHDANVVACALAHGAASIVTDNTRHFARFAGLIAIEDLAAVQDRPRLKDALLADEGRTDTLARDRGKARRRPAPGLP